MKALLIDPFARKITTVQMDTYDGEWIRQILECQGFGIDPVREDHHIITGLGMVEKPGMRFWAFQNQPPIAGRALVRGNSKDGLQAQDCTIDPVLLEQNIIWPDIEFDGWMQVPKFRPLQTAQVAAQPQAALPAPPANDQPQAKPEGNPWSIWTITEDVDVGYIATLISVDGQGNPVKTGTTLENEDLEELRNMLPQDLVKVDRTQTDAANLVESWMSRPSN
jgi:hypothetical protein